VGVDRIGVGATPTGVCWATVQALLSKIITHTKRTRGRLSINKLVEILLIGANAQYTIYTPP
jgi:hypothetical protein